MANNNDPVVVPLDDRMSGVTVGLTDGFKSAALWVLIGAIAGMYLNTHMNKGTFRRNRRDNDED